MHEYKNISLFADTHYICISVSYKFFRGKNKFNLIFIIRYLSHTLYKKMQISYLLLSNYYTFMILK